ncbi:MAG: hypothetical protein A2V66_16880 [Ignavibacteria bacterium RBG_13_36_8]|nr:MAG: hypothetical protein A2V66_16880 [Ignavibacteria bacterium RBG_13_36_8]
MREKRIDNRLDVIEEKLDCLTRREREIAQYAHLSEKEIADLLNISSATVKKIKSNIYSKLGIHKATELIQIINGLGEAERKYDG